MNEITNMITTRILSLYSLAVPVLLVNIAYRRVEGAQGGPCTQRIIYRRTRCAQTDPQRSVVWGTAQLLHDSVPHGLHKRGRQGPGIIAPGHDDERHIGELHVRRHVLGFLPGYGVADRHCLLGQIARLAADMDA